MAAPKTTKKKAAPKKAAAQKLHYDKEALLEDYNHVFSYIMKAMAIFLGVTILYFLVYIVYLGEASHTPPGPFVEQFGDRVDIEYAGKKIPLYENQ